MSLLYIKEDTTVGELKKFLANIADDAKIYTPDSNIRFDHYPAEPNDELYIEEV